MDTSVRGRGFAHFHILAGLHTKQHSADELLRGMTRTELAAKIHTSPAVISRLERGRNVELKTLRKVAAALDARLTVEPLAS